MTKTKNGFFSAKHGGSSSQKRGIQGLNWKQPYFVHDPNRDTYFELLLSGPQVGWWRCQLLRVRIACWRPVTPLPIAAIAVLWLVTGGCWMSVVPWGALQQGKGVVKPRWRWWSRRQLLWQIWRSLIMKGQWHGLGRWVLLWTDTVGRRFREELAPRCTKSCSVGSHGSRSLNRCWSAAFM